MKRQFCLIVSSLFIYGCSFSQHTKVIEKDNYDTLLTSPIIIFYSVNQNQFDSIIDTCKFPGVFNDYIEDFFMYKYLFETKNENRNNVKIVLDSSNSVFKFKISSSFYYYDKTKKESPVGIIMYDGKRDPLVIEKMETDIEILKEFNKYFK